MPVNQRNRVSAYGAVIAACTLSAITASVHSADSSDPSRNTGLPCGYEVAAIIKGPVHPFFGQASLIATGMNELGWATGFYFWFDTDHAFYWTPDTGLHTIPLPAGFNRAIANDVNDHGVVVGDMEGPEQHWRGFVYDTNTGAMTILEPVQNIGSAQCWANAINNDGVVVGARSLGETQQPYNAFIWTPNKDDPTHGTYTDLGVMNGPNSTATDINAVGETVGWHGPSSIIGESFHFYGDELTLIEPVAGANFIQGISINNHGQICGQLHLLKGSDLVWKYGFVLNDSTFTFIEPLPEFNTVTAGYINNAGTVTGFFPVPDAPGGDWKAFVWHGENARLLNALLPREPAVDVQRPRDINDSGLIVARGKHASKNVGILLSPVYAPLGDLSGSCDVGPDDLGILLSEWGKQQSPADLNDDGVVNGADLAILLGNWTR